MGSNTQFQQLAAAIEQEYKDAVMAAEATRHRRLASLREMKDLAAKYPLAGLQLDVEMYNDSVVLSSLPIKPDLAAHGGADEDDSKPDGSGATRGQLMKVINDAIDKLHDRFNLYDIKHVIEETGGLPGGELKNNALTQVLRRLEGRGVVRTVEPGIGRRPAVYESLLNKLAGRTRD
jgi:hypothetical protein